MFVGYFNDNRMYASLEPRIVKVHVDVCRFDQESKKYCVNLNDPCFYSPHFLCCKINCFRGDFCGTDTPTISDPPRSFKIYTTISHELIKVRNCQYSPGLSCDFSTDGPISESRTRRLTMTAQQCTMFVQ